MTHFLTFLTHALSTWAWPLIGAVLLVAAAWTAYGLREYRREIRRISGPGWTQPHPRFTRRAGVPRGVRSARRGR